MRIGIYAPNLAAPGASGVERYSVELIRALSGVARGHEFVIFTDAEDLPIPAGGRRVHVPTMGRWRRLCFDHARLAELVRQEGVDLLHCTKTFVPAGLTCPSVSSVYDVIFLEQPRLYPWIWRLYWNRALRDTVRRATLLLCVSEDSAGSLVRHLPEAGSRTRVVPAGVDAGRFAAPVPDGKEVLRRLGVAGPYFLCVGNITARKNIPVVLEAYRRLPPEGRPFLVVAGHRIDGELPRGPGVLHVEGISDSDLAALYQGALAYVCASEREGFGFPVLEAMAAGTPVVTTTRGALGEVAGDAVLPVPPGDAKALGDAMIRVTGNRELRARLSALGRARASGYRWAQVAERTMDVYEQATAGAGR